MVTKGEEELRPFEEAGWWYRIVERIGQKDVPTAKLPTENTVNGGQEKNGCRRTGIGHGTTRNANSVYNNVTSTGGEGTLNV